MTGAGHSRPPIQLAGLDALPFQALPLGGCAPGGSLELLQHGTDTGGLVNTPTLTLRLPFGMLGDGAQRCSGLLIECVRNGVVGGADQPVDLDWRVVAPGGGPAVDHGRALLRPYAGILLGAHQWDGEHLQLELSVRAECLAGRRFTPQTYGLRALGFRRSELWPVLEDRIVWILSSARSGTTWLAQMLGEFWGVHHLDENVVGRMLGAHQWDATRFAPQPASFWEPHETAPAWLDGWVAPDLPPRQVFSRHLQAWADRPMAISGRRSVDVLARNMRDMQLEQVLRLYGLTETRVVIAKCPNDTHGLDLMAGWMPRSRLVMVVRDGRDTIRSRFTPFASQILATTEDPELRRYACATYAHLWNLQMDAARHALAAHDPERAIQVRYEELRADPQAVMAAICRVSGIPASPEQVAETVARHDIDKVPDDQKGADKPVQSGRVGGFQEVFSRGEIEVMSRIMAANLKRYGYRV